MTGDDYRKLRGYLRKIAKDVYPDMSDEQLDGVLDSLEKISTNNEGVPTPNKMMMKSLSVPSYLDPEEVMAGFRDVITRLEEKYNPWLPGYKEYQREHHQEAEEYAAEKWGEDRMTIMNKISEASRILSEKVGKTPKEFSLTVEDILTYTKMALEEYRDEQLLLLSMKKDCDEWQRKQFYADAYVHSLQIDWLMENSFSEFLFQALEKIDEFWKIIAIRDAQQKIDNEMLPPSDKQTDWDQMLKNI